MARISGFAIVSLGTYLSPSASTEVPRLPSPAANSPEYQHFEIAKKHYSGSTRKYDLYIKYLIVNTALILN